MHKARFLLDHHSTTILTAVGVGGTVATAVLTGRATFKAAELIAKAQTEVEKDVEADWVPLLPGLSKTEKVKLVWREYLPPTATCITTVTCIIVANKISSKKIAALAVAGGISERALQEYKEKVVEKLGARQDEKIRDEIAQEHVTNNPPTGVPVIINGTGDVLCYDDLTGRYFHSNIEKIKHAENNVNYSILQDDSCGLSYFFDEIGLKPTTYTDQVGWNINTRMEVRFSTTMTDDGRPCLVLGFINLPVVDYDKPWGRGG